MFDTYTIPFTPDMFEGETAIEFGPISSVLSVSITVSEKSSFTLIEVTVFEPAFTARTNLLSRVLVIA